MQGVLRKYIAQMKTKFAATLQITHDSSTFFLLVEILNTFLIMLSSALALQKQVVVMNALLFIESFFVFLFFEIYVRVDSSFSPTNKNEVYSRSENSNMEGCLLLFVLEL